MSATALPRIANLNQAATALNARHAALTASKADLLAQASDALDCAEQAATDAGKRRFINAAREIIGDADAVAVQIAAIEACWTPVTPSVQP